LPKFLIL